MPLNNGEHISYHQYLEGGGEMGRLTRSFDWSGTVLGSPDKWSSGLLTTVSILLNSRFPMFLWWGEELIQFYNDAYRPSLGNNGKHPKALGQRGKDCWPEIWPVIKPLIDQVMAGGESTWSEDQLIPIYRNNRLEDVYWTFSYSKVNGASGKPGGVLVICTETTEKVKSRKKLEATVNALAESEARVRYMLADAPVAIAVFTGQELIIEAANDKILEVWGKSREITGMPLHKALPELKGQPFLRLLDDVFTTGKPFYGKEVKALLEHQLILKESYFNFVYHPLKNAEDRTVSIMAVAVDITEEVIARKQLEKAQDILKLAIDAAGIGIWSADLITGNLTVSDRARIIHGIPPETDLTLTEAATMIPYTYRDRVMGNIELAIHNKESFDEEYWINPMDGSSPKWLKSTGKAYYNEKGNAMYVTGTILDITEQKEDDIRKNDFIGMVSHELKTPLTSLSAILQILHRKIKGTEDVFITGALDKANIQVRKMTALINGFLNMSRLESGKIQLNKQDFNLNDLIKEAIEEIELTVSSHPIRLMPGEPVIIKADQDKIAAVILNLLTNAVKYSPKGTAIEITCTIVDNMARVSVKDEGPGIAPIDKEKVFERYYRVENNDNKHIAGFGIGLYLSTEIIQRHAGKIWLESEKGKGSTFYFSLPLF